MTKASPLVVAVGSNSTDVNLSSRLRRFAAGALLSLPSLSQGAEASAEVSDGRFNVANIPLTPPAVGTVLAENIDLPQAFGESSRAWSDEVIAQPPVMQIAPAAPSVDIAGDGTPVVVTLGEALKRLQSGNAGTRVVELENPTTNHFAYMFQDSNDQTSYIVRGVTAGTERDMLLEKLHEAGMRVSPEDSSKDTPSLTSDIANGITLGVGQVLGLILAGYVGWRVYAHYRDKNEDEMEESDNSAGDWERPTETFADVGGNYELVAEMKELKKDIAAFQGGDDEIELPHGVLITGETGLGKTFMVRVLAGEVACPVMICNTASLLSGSYMGEWSNCILETFEAARMFVAHETARLRNAENASGDEHGVVIIFFDEFDSLGKSRERMDGGAEEERKRALNGLLAEMDGTSSEQNRGIIVVAASNFGDSLDEALKRPGRFTKQLKVVAAQCAAERLDVLQKVAQRVLPQRRMELERPELLEYLSRITGGESNDHLRGIIELSCTLARRADRRVITEADVFEAYQQQSFGAIRDQAVSPDKQELIAYHENGHGLVGYVCGLKPLIVSMKARGNTGGRVVLDSERLTEGPMTKDDLLRAILVSAAGRAGELERNGGRSPSAGVSSDFEHIRDVCRVIFSSGMLGQHYAYSMESLERDEVMKAYVDEVNALTENAIIASREVLQQANGGFGELVRQSMALDRELIGAEAEEFFAKNVTPDKIEEMTAIVEAFLSDPLRGHPQSMIRQGIADAMSPTFKRQQ